MAENAYPLQSTNLPIEFTFVSEGASGRILKIIRFDPVREGIWNLAFGDSVNGELDDSVISNNGDVAKVLGTVAAALYEFSRQRPEISILIFPVDERRKQLYNIAFRRRQREIEQTFQVLGGIDGSFELYRPEIEFDFFLLSRRRR